MENSQVNITEMMRSRCEKRLRKIFKLKPEYLEYNTDPEFGEIGSWILKSIKGKKNALRLLIDKVVTIYVHQHFGSAFFKWDYYEQEFFCQLWQHKKLLDEFRTGEINSVELKMKEYWSFCKYKRGKYAESDMESTN